MIARVALVAALLSAGSASASPKTADARAQFDKGVQAYTKGDYAAAAEALGASFVIEADAETLFAWAQTERKLGHCDRAIDLYKKLLGMKMPAENKQAVQVSINECKAIIAEQKSKGTEPKPTESKTKPESKPKTIEQKPKPIEQNPKPTETPPVETQPEPPPVETRPPPPEEPKQPEGRTWWKDPVGGALVGAGAVGVGLGIVFLVQGSAADSDKDHAASYSEYEQFANRAESRGRLGVISLVVGGACAAGGVYWYVSHKPKHETRLTTVVVPSGAGVVLSGRF